MNILVRKLRYRFRRPLPKRRRRCKRPRKWKRAYRFAIVLGVMLCLLSTLFFLGEHRLGNLVFEQAASKLNNRVVTEVSQAAEEIVSMKQLDYQSLIQIREGEDGQIQALSTDLNQVGGLKSALAQEIAKRMESLTRLEVKVPLGAFFSDTIMTGFGVNIPVRVLSSGDVQLDFKDDFESVGINQVRHRLMIEVKVKAEIIAPGRDQETEISTLVPIGETIIVGGVPDTYLSLGQ